MVTDIGEVGYAFKSNYKNIVIVMLMTAVKILLWSLLFLIPGIIKAYSYRMVGYMLGENPDMDYQDAQKLSALMMSGNKWAAFVYDLSFIGWYLLAGITFGIVGLLYTSPYKYSSYAALYLRIKEQYILCE